MKKLILFLYVVAFLTISACKKDTVTWPITPAEQPQSGNNSNLPYVAVYSVAGNAQKTTSVASSNRKTVTNYYYTVSFIVYSPDINDTTAIYTSTQTDTLKDNYTQSNPFQVIIPVTYAGCIKRSEFVVIAVQQIITTKLAGHPAVPTTDTTYVKTQVGGEANGSENCESFTKGTISTGTTNYMIFSQTGSAVLD